MKHNTKMHDALIKEGEGESLEFKRSTGELKEAMQTLCAFLNGKGGTVLFGIRPDGKPEGQEVTDKTLRDIAHASDRFEPPAHLSINRIKIGEGRDLIEVTVEQLSKKHDSKPVNPLVAGAFHRTGAVEVWGRGTNRVIAMCKKHGCAPPTFEDRQGFLIVTFKAQSVQEAGTGTGAISTVEKSREKSREKVLSLIEENTDITTAEMATGLGLSQAGIEKIIRTLKSEGCLRRVGSDKSGHWEIVK